MADRYAESPHVRATCCARQEVPAPRRRLRRRPARAADGRGRHRAHARRAPRSPRSLPPTHAAQRAAPARLAAAAVVVVGGTAGVAAAAESALPGDALYPIKRGIESAEVALNTSDAGKGQDLLAPGRATGSTRSTACCAERRLGRARSPHTLDDFTAQADRGRRPALRRPTSERRPDDDRRAARRSRPQPGHPARSSPTTRPPDAQDGASTRRCALLADLDQQARVLCGDLRPRRRPTAACRVTSAPGADQPARRTGHQAQQAAAGREAAAARASCAERRRPAAPRTTPTPPSTDAAGDARPSRRPTGDAGEPLRRRPAASRTVRAGRSATPRSTGSRCRT